MKEENENKDLLKAFVESNRKDFDTHEPPTMDFTKLMPSPPKKGEAKMIPIAWLYRAVAIFVVLISAIGLTYFLTNTTTDAPTIATTEEPEVIDFNLSEISPEMAELESYYTEQVAIKQAAIKSMGLDEEISEEIAALDEEFNNLKNELGTSVDNHLIVNEMIKTYKLKLDLLENVLENMQESYDDKNLTQHTNDEEYTTYY